MAGNAILIAELERESLVGILESVDVRIVVRQQRLVIGNSRLCSVVLAVTPKPLTVPGSLCDLGRGYSTFR